MFFRSTSPPSFSSKAPSPPPPSSPPPPPSTPPTSASSKEKNNTSIIQKILRSASKPVIDAFKRGREKILFSHGKKKASPSSLHSPSPKRFRRQSRTSTTQDEYTDLEYLILKNKKQSSPLQQKRPMESHHLEKTIKPPLSYIIYSTKL